MRKKIILSVLALVAMAGGLAGISALESQIVNVTARIGSGLNVSVDEISFGTISPEEEAEKSFKITLSNSFNANTTADPVSICDGENLIQNGGFETPVITNQANWDVFANGTTGVQWKVEWKSTQTTYQGQPRPSDGILEFHAGVNDWLAQEGEQYVELDTDWDGPEGSLTGEPALVRISQNVNTEENEEYKLSYYYSPKPGTESAENVLTVKVNGDTVKTHVVDGLTNTQTAWVYVEHSFEADEDKTKIEFVAGGIANSEGILLDNVKLVKCSDNLEASLSYSISQQPKCADPTDSSKTAPAMENGGEFECPEGYELLPNLCPFLSKTESTSDGSSENDGDPITAFHGSFENWTVEDTEEFMTTGQLSAEAGDTEDEWIIGLEAPCFEGSCSSEWENEGYEIDPALALELLGCDLLIDFSDLNND